MFGRDAGQIWGGDARYVSADVRWHLTGAHICRIALGVAYLVAIWACAM